MLTDRVFAVAHIVDQVVLYLLLLLSVVSIAIILERFFALKKISASSASVRNRLKLALASNQLEDVQEFSKDPETVEGRALAIGLKHMKENGSRGLEEVFNTHAMTERPELEKYLNFLATLGANAPYIGLFGTVLGIMKAFNDLANSPEAGQQTVMAGISIALVATAAGLFVAIPAVVAYNYYRLRVKAILANLESIKEFCLALAKKKGV